MRLSKYFPLAVFFVPLIVLIMFVSELSEALKKHDIEEFFFILGVVIFQFLIAFVCYRVLIQNFVDLTDAEKSKFRQYGKKYWTEFSCVKTKWGTKFNKAPVAVVFAQLVDTLSGKIRSFRSRTIWISDTAVYQAMQNLQLLDNMRKCYIPVYVDPVNPKKYFLDVENLVLEPEDFNPAFEKLVYHENNVNIVTEKRKANKWRLVARVVVVLVVLTIGMRVLIIFNRDVCTAFIQWMPTWSFLYYDRGYDYYVKKNYLNAIADFSKYLEVERHNGRVIPKNVDVHFYRGNAFLESGFLLQAIADYTVAIKLNTNIAEAFDNRGCCFVELEEHEVAISDFKQAIQMNPNSAKPYYDIAVEYDRLWRIDDAIENYERFLEHADPLKYVTNSHNGVTKVYYNDSVSRNIPAVKRRLQELINERSKQAEN
ncbi:MAG: putative UDP-N-acetylglucosamine-peptide N-acetylglucosaminyltransferase [Firmicutes bacterium]|nr:putative UDP-N-acetylglucosamine-peptide N-acetylglucosaminyltransferase [Bacillota bacterium]